MLELRIPVRYDVPLIFAFCAVGTLIDLALLYWLVATVIGWFR